MSPCFECSFCPRRFISFTHLFDIIIHLSPCAYSTFFWTYHWTNTKNNITNHNIKLWGTWIPKIRVTSYTFRLIIYNFSKYAFSSLFCQGKIWFYFGVIRIFFYFWSFLYTQILFQLLFEVGQNLRPSLSKFIWS